MITPAQYCKVCGLQLSGRRDKKYCNPSCKNTYHYLMRQTHYNEISEEINFLLRNRTILKEVLDQENSHQKMVRKAMLQRMGFQFGNYTGSTQLKNSHRLFYVFDYSWIKYSNNDILLQKRKGISARQRSYVP